MADFCQQCSLETFGEDFEELAGITKPEDQAKNLYAIVLCEGCGAIQVDTQGRCISHDCLLKHGAPAMSTPAAPTRLITLAAPIVGMHFRPPAKGIISCLGAGHPLLLQREHDNKYDPLAIKVLVDATTFSPEFLDTAEVVCQEYGHDRESLLRGEEVDGEPTGFWHLGYIAAKPPKGVSAETLNRDIAPKMTLATDYPATLNFGLSGEYLATVALPEGLPAGSV